MNPLLGSQFEMEKEMTEMNHDASPREKHNGIQFAMNRLSILYLFKKRTIQLCLTFIKEVVKNSSQSKSRTLLSKLKDIETDLYDIFCRWTFNSIQQGTFDFEYFLPTDSFIQMKDLSYYVKRFHLELDNSLIPFPHHEFQALVSYAQEDAIAKGETNLSDEYPQHKCSEVQLVRLQRMYKGDPNQFKRNVARLLSRYYYLGGLNNSLSTPPPVLQLFQSHELFGTPMNTCSSNYCSPFSDERIFGSSGSFFDFSAFRDDVVYFANPPFDDSLCSQMTTKLLAELEKRVFALIVIIPVWDKDEQDKYGLKNFGLPFDGYQRLVKSPYFINEIFLPKNHYPFYNYFYQKYVYISNTHLINLGKPVDIQQIQQRWSTVKNK